MISEWEKSIESYKFVIDHFMMNHEEDIILQLINSLIALERYDDAKKSECISL